MMINKAGLYYEKKSASCGTPVETFIIPQYNT